jgi:hypothetical protein
MRRETILPASHALQAKPEKIKVKPSPPGPPSKRASKGGKRKSRSSSSSPGGSADVKKEIRREGRRSMSISSPSEIHHKPKLEKESPQISGRTKDPGNYFKSIFLQNILNRNFSKNVPKQV